MYYLIEIDKLEETSNKQLLFCFSKDEGMISIWKSSETDLQAYFL